MRNTAKILIFLLLPLAARAQSISIGPITKLAYCVGDTMYVPYTASGPFAGDNHFFAELSDASGSFGSFTSFGNLVPLNGSIAIPMAVAGDNFRVRVASSDPYDTTTNNGQDIGVSRKPSPEPEVYRRSNAYYGIKMPFMNIVGLIKSSIQFSDASSEPVGAKYLWSFNQDANLMSSPIKTPQVTYYSEGIKTGSVDVSLPQGCDTAVNFWFKIISCTPFIPVAAHLVLGTESGLRDTSIWVKAGGNYTRTNDPNAPPQTFFVETGGTLTISNQYSNSLIYLKPGASINFDPGGGSFSTIVCNSGTTLSVSGENQIDTFNCPDLVFDYSQVAGVSDEEPSVIVPVISQRGDKLYVSASEAGYDIHLFNILGNAVLTRSSNGDLDVDLTPLPPGVYFAEVTAGNQREVRRIIR